MPISKVAAIKLYFESQPNGREVKRDELLALSKDREGYEWVANECAKALNETLETPVAAK